MSEVISKERIQLIEELSSKEEAIHLMADMFQKDQTIQDSYRFMKDIYQREQEFCTYVGHETAIPHAISNMVNHAGIAFIRTNKALNYGEPGEDVRLLFMLAIPEDSNTEHLRMLSMLAARLMHKEFREHLFQAQTVDEVYDLLHDLH